MPAAAGRHRDTQSGSRNRTTRSKNRSDNLPLDYAASFGAESGRRRELDMATDIDPDFARRKLDEIFALHEVGRDLLFAGARHDFPQKSDEELWRIVAERAARRRRGKWGHNEPGR